MLAKLVWLVISAVAAGSLAVVTGVVNPGEKVNALWLVTAAACFYLVAYRFYGAFLAAKVLSLNPHLKT
ncbi:carbon starvation protein A, partial [bacterium]|nr:carbon starvation protein A [bacterium]